MDYRIYHLNLRQKLLITGEGLGISVLIAYLFYDSWYGLVLFPAFVLVCRKKLIVDETAKRQERLSDQFIDALRSMSTALLAGFSVENAWKEACHEVGMLHGKDSDLYRELKVMNQMAAMNMPLEDVLFDFAGRSGNEDVLEFAEVFRFAKRGGGDFVSIIESTVSRISGKRETKREIEVVVASKKLEQQVMNVIPIGILAYLKFSSPDYMDPLYGNALGICFMTGCLAAYGAAILISQKVLDIKI